VKKARILCDSNGKSKGAGFAEFSSSTAAAAAIQTCSGVNLAGKRLILQAARS